MTVFRKKTKKRLLIILILILATVIAGTVFFFSMKKTDSLKLEPHSKTVFSKYQLLDDTIISLLKDANNNFIFYDDKKNELFKTEDFIEDFYILDSTTIAYKTFTYDSELKKNNIIIKILDIPSKTSKEIYATYNNILFSSYNNRILILNKTKNEILYENDKKEFDVVPLNEKYTQIIKDNNRIFLISYNLKDNDISSNIAEFKDNAVNSLFTINNKVINITTDYNNTNKVYLTYEETTSKNEIYSTDTVTNISVMEKYIINLSTLNNGENIYPKLTGIVISLKDKTLFVNMKDYSIYLLTEDMSIGSKVDSINTSTLWSFIQKDSNQNHLYYINDKGYTIHI